MSNRKARILNGYRLVHLPDHPKAMHTSGYDGYVYEHIYVTEKYSRPIRIDEVVHHLDGNRSNNNISNLLIVSRDQHNKLHAWMNAGAPGLASMVNKGAICSTRISEIVVCPICDHTVQIGKGNAMYCSDVCHHIAVRKTDRPTKEVLSAEIQSMPTTKVGKKYGVSDNAVRKWAKAYGITHLLPKKKKNIND